MPYMLRYKTNIVQQSLPRILFLSEDPTLASLYVGHLENKSFAVTHIQDWDLLINKALSFLPKVVIVNFASESALTSTRLASMRELARVIPIVAIGINVRDTFVRTLSEVGIVGYIDRKLSRPTDVSVIIEQIISR